MNKQQRNSLILAVFLTTCIVYLFFVYPGHLDKLLSAWRSKDSKDTMPDWPPFTMTIPDDIPDDVRIVNPDWSEQRVNGKEYYANAYRRGWKRCLYDFEKHELDFSKAKPESSNAENFRIGIRGWDDGYLRCWQIIRELTQSRP